MQNEMLEQKKWEIIEISEEMREYIEELHPEIEYNYYLTLINYIDEITLLIEQMWV